MAKKAGNAAARVLIGLGLALIAATVAIAAVVFMMDGAAGHPAADPQGRVDPESENPIDWEYWLSVNPDIVGWVRVEGTGIDHPIVQAHADDPLYYLDHDVYGNWNLWGAVYLDSGCEEEGMDSWNVVVFGHNMSYPPAMFHDFENYYDEGYAREHASVDIYTPAEVRHLGVYGIDTVDGWEQVKKTDFAGASDYWAFREERLGACEVKLSEDEGAFGQMYMFCTCSYRFNPADERTLVYAL